MNLKDITALIIDIDGVIFEDEQKLGDIENIFRTIKSLNLAFVIATNNSSRTREYCVELFQKHGVAITVEHVVNSVAVTLDYLQTQVSPNAALHVLGSQVLKDEMRKAGYTLVEDLSQIVEAVIVGIDKEFTYQKLKIASLHIQQGAKFIATNDDRTVKSPEGLIPASGAIVSALETASSVKARVMGKPHAPMFALARQYLGKPCDQVLMIGDQLETDIEGAQRLGFRTALVLSGVCDAEKAKAWSPDIDIMVQDLQSLVDLLGGKEIA